MGEAKAKEEKLKLVSPVDGSELRSGPRLSHPVTRDGHPIPFFPIGRRLVVERIPEETMIAGFLIPDQAKVQQQFATLIAAGPAAMGVLDDAGIAIGDTICFGKYSGTHWEWQPAGTDDYKSRRRVDMINVDDVFGCKELADKLIDGTLGISLHAAEDPADADRYAREAADYEAYLARLAEWSQADPRRESDRPVRPPTPRPPRKGEPEYRFFTEVQKG